MPPSLASLVESGLTAAAVLSAAAPGAVFDSAVTDWPGLSGEQAAALLAAETAGVENAEITERFTGERAEGLMRAGAVEGEPIRQILLATTDETGRLTTVKSFFNSTQPFTTLRNRAKAVFDDLPAEAWTVPWLPPDPGEYSAKPNHKYSPALSFHSPILRKSVAPEPLASRVLGHASSVYGARAWSELSLDRGNHRIGYFTGDIQGKPVSIASVMRFDEDGLAEVLACSRPWSSAVAIYSHIKARLGQELGPDYFWAGQPDYDSYL
ncbi:hypothetical protein AB0K15_38745 [Amycolatopsis sp. NPDC049253]|uniref:hypothetical protein n=1 Tax=Amycolatopsis sp. NPDC049253 TaxID=3155274 RepID=UPI00341ED5B6